MIIGIDMGGTHIDGVVIADGKMLRRSKRPVNRARLFDTIWTTLDTLLEGLNRAAIRRIHLSTTVSTNAIVEGKTSKVALILQRGPGMNWSFDELEAPCYELSGSVDHRGSVVRLPDPDEVDRIRQALADDPVEALAIVTKFCTRNPETELRMAKAFGEAYDHITLGHTLSGRLNFPRRVRTAYLNAAVAARFREFATLTRQALEEEGVKAPIYILKADGGTMDLETALEKPVESILSGPAASFMGMQALFSAEDDTDGDADAPARSSGDTALLDIGGTTSDLFLLVDGVPVFEPEGIEIDGHKTLVRAIYSRSIGLGGDSHVRLEDGELKIGPRREGDALAFGGPVLTPTDALVYLGHMDADDPERAEAGLQALADEAGMSVRAMAETIVHTFAAKIRDILRDTVATLNGRPVYTIRELLEGPAIAPEHLRVIGGPAKALAAALEEATELPVSIPDAYEVANAIGAALAKPTAELHLHADTDRGRLTIPELDIYESVDSHYDLAQAEARARRETEALGRRMGLSEKDAEAEITESESFNMVKGWFGVERNIRVHAQIRPGLLHRLEVSS